MKFGKDFRNHLEETLPAWRDKYLAYKALKKLIKNLPPPGVDAPPPPLPPPPPPPPAAAGAEGEGGGHGVGHGNIALGIWFARILDMELHKLNEFYMEREEWYVIRLQVLKERIDRVKAKKNDAFTSKSEFTEEMLEIRKDFVIIHGEMILLQTYSSLNFAGLVKILKKYDKRTGGLLSLPFTQRARHQPFFTTEPLTRLVRECEANLELLFPVEAEVLEPGSSAKLEQHDDVARRDPTSSCDVETSDVYRGTLAAIKAMQGLRRASSTYNPLSLSRFFHGEDGEACSGAITSESSLSDSSTGSQIQDAGKDDNEVQSREQNAAQREHNAEGEPRDE
ncbi:SPX domain-containing protein 4-like [Phragmites australis]|uniref:SPX domain-containing protein 4-like n=1 Tax=Phragmites australis TaxID=29695 RepID=UPI002D792EAC|nr:SPX domain-containing protein 4-like [Phragmites australis]